MSPRRTSVNPRPPGSPRSPRRPASSGSWALPLLFASLVVACATELGEPSAPPAETDIEDTGRRDACEAVSFPVADLPPATPADAPPIAGARDRVLYEVQLRSANACRTDLGTTAQREACARKPAPDVEYRAREGTCPILDELERIRLGTIDDMLAPTSDIHAGLTLDYIRDAVGPVTIWLMPPFPSNDVWQLPEPCDNLGSPYAVRDYMHVRASLSRRCIEAGRDERSSEPCWSDETFAELVRQAEAQDLRIMLDVAFNHVGHGYRFYDYVAFDPIERQLDAVGGDVEALHDFEATFDEALIDPEVLDRVEELESGRNDLTAADTAVVARCPTLAGQRRVRAAAAWRVGTEVERAAFRCDATWLDELLPGFLLSSDRRSPSSGPGDAYSGPWRDVTFLFMRSDTPTHRHTYLRNREYLFRIMNLWTARGVHGYRLDHSTDSESGLSPDDWAYIIGKTRFYASLRGQEPPVILAEEFHDQQGMRSVADIMTEGYLFDINARDGREKTNAHFRSAIANSYRFDGDVLVMAALENHDELRLVDGTGYDPWTGAGVWALGAANWNTPMLLMGQELGAQERLEFRRSDLLRARFETNPDTRAAQRALRSWYARIITARADPRNAALRSRDHRFLIPDDQPVGGPRPIVQLRWGEGPPIMLVHNVWRQRSGATISIPPDVAGRAGLEPCTPYRLVDAMDPAEAPTTLVPCRTGATVAAGTTLSLGPDERALWLRLERCTAN